MRQNIKRNHSMDLVKAGLRITMLRGNAGKPTMRMDHEVGDKMYVDFAGMNSVSLISRSGEVQRVEVFVVILRPLFTKFRTMIFGTIYALGLTGFFIFNNNNCTNNYYAGKYQ